MLVTARLRALLNRRMLDTTSPAFWVALWHLNCPIIKGGGAEVPRGVYLLLAVFLVQLSGLRSLCVPGRRLPHACCPINSKASLPSSSSLPDCCITSLLNYQGSITERRNTDRPSQYTAQSAALSVPSAAPLVAIGTPVVRLVLPSASPPLSPLSQSCLLRI